MRNLLLALLLANLLFLAWQLWIEPEPPAASQQAAGPRLALFTPATGQDPPLVGNPNQPQGPLPATLDPAATPDGKTPAAGGPDLAAVGEGACFRVGPMPDIGAAGQAVQLLTGRGLRAEVVSREGQAWLGHWVQIPGFGTPQLAENARKRLMAGGLVDVYLMQDGETSLVSLGVFRERARAERVLAAAQQLGFSPILKDRFRPNVETWVLVQPAPGGKPDLADLRLGNEGILRAEEAPCAGQAAPGPVAWPAP
jgi:hypothetical protein